MQEPYISFDISQNRSINKNIKSSQINRQVVTSGVKKIFLYLAPLVKNNQLSNVKCRSELFFFCFKIYQEHIQRIEVK